MPKLIKKGDLVRSSPARTRAPTGTVIAAYPREDRVVVEGVNMIKKHTKETNQGPRGAKAGGVQTMEAPIHVSNVKKLKETASPPRRATADEDGTKVRFAPYG